MSKRSTRSNKSKTSSSKNSGPPEWTNLAEVANDKLGGRVISTSDEWFAPAANMIKIEEPVWKPDLYVSTGKWMDGWESRRHNPYEYDWVISRLGCAANIVGVDVNTMFFNGNQCPEVSIEILDLSEEESKLGSELSDEDVISRTDWKQILSKKECGPTCHNYFRVEISGLRATHVKVKMYPDGGIARFRAYGVVDKNWSLVDDDDENVEFLSLLQGGTAIACSDQHFGSKEKLCSPWPPVDMSSGWETKRSRGKDHSDWVILKLGHTALINKLEVSTQHFKGNNPQAIAFEGALIDEQSINDIKAMEKSWKPLLDSKYKLFPHKMHVFASGINKDIGPINVIRATIFPDGGIARVRAYGRKHVA